MYVHPYTHPSLDPTIHPSIHPSIHADMTGGTRRSKTPPKHTGFNLFNYSITYMVMSCARPRGGLEERQIHFTRFIFTNCFFFSRKSCLGPVWGGRNESDSERGWGPRCMGHASTTLVTLCTILLRLSNKTGVKFWEFEPLKRGN